LVQRLVSEAGGGVAARSDGPGCGATFIVTLPLVPEPTAPPAAAPEPPRAAGARVLLVEDEELIRDGVAELLTEEGLEVVRCASGEDALVAFAEDPEGFDAAVVDHGLPGMDGCTLIGILLESRPDLACVLASGYAATTRFQDLQRIGVAFFQKPYEVRDLVRLLASAGAGRGLRATTR
jgi:DNA-binding NtrC family response regulator